MASRVYGMVWRWHFLAGLAATPLVAVLALTGALYVFQPELERAVYAEQRVVTPRGEMLPIDALVANGPRECRGSVVAPMRATDALRLWCPDEGKRSVFIDPYTGAVLGDEVWDDTIFGFVLKIHWELYLGENGRLAVEWATSWTIVLLVSGAYLWWPRRRSGGTWWPRRDVRGRQFLRDVHSIAGAYMLPALFIIAATGLFWTRLAGEDRWKRIASDRADDIWSAPPKSRLPAGRIRIGYDRALAAAGVVPGQGVLEASISIDDAPDAAYLVYQSSPDHDAPWATRIQFLDAYDGRLLRTVRWDDRALLNQLGEAGYSIHVGAIAGWPGRILALLASLVLVALCVTGPWMWWKRRPRGKLGIPPRAERFAWPLLAGLAALGVLMPTVGYTLIVFGAAEVVALAVRARRR